MGWTFKTEDDIPVIISPEKEDHSPEVNRFYDPDINYDNCGEDRIHPETGELLIRITIPEWNKLSDIRMPDAYLKGNGWTGKSISIEERQKRALAKNPMHTTMNDYKSSNPDSVVSKARQKNLKRMNKRKVDVRKNKTEGI